VMDLLSSPPMLQPHFEASVKMKLTLPKVRTWSPPKLPKIQSLIVGVKTPHIEMASHEPFGHMQHKLWLKKGSGIKLAIWLLITKNRESTWSWCVQVECNTSLESSRGELQVFFRPHPNRRSELRVMSSQSPKSPHWDNFETSP
jgi:hypothetical protein